MAYTYQAPKDFDAQSAKFKAKHGTLENLCKNANYMLQLKYDGVFSVVYTSDAISQSRQGEAQPAAQHLAELARSIFGPDMLVFMELWIPGETFKTINGLSRRKEAQPTLQGRVFDAITAKEFAAGKSEKTYVRRIAAIEDMLWDAGQKGLKGLEAASGEELTEADVDAALEDHNGLVAYACKIVADNKTNAYDGLILRDLNAYWLPGACKEGEAIKIKPVMSLDLRVIAQHAEQRASKLGGFLTVDYKGVPTDVGSGLTQNMLYGIMAEQEGAAGAQNFVSSIAEVECLGVFPETGRLREPRLKSIRHDTQREEDK